MSKRDEPMYTADDMANATKAVAKEIAQEMGATMMALFKGQLEKAMTPPQAPKGNRHIPECEACRLLVTGCGGVPKIKPHEDGSPITQAELEAAYRTNHVKMVVYPERYPEFGEWFRGIGVNGIWFLSNGPGHAIWVPTACEGAFRRQINEFERNERETRLGRDKIHNSGDVRNPRPVQAAQDGWR